ncbi:7,8-dihydropterin-6-yl-methyl-4-(beta-D-ribofuranosyl)aminobenzene 5'-phosphate synthase [Thermoanaerobacter thermohydrosulfuricus]|uniref:Metal-dependent hydrolase, beta-lactamase superfamily II n=2 Tax=Thermoanaerobacter TaxID=1754 RepID=I9KRI7_9THEO|nr:MULTISPECIES: MBL fold metallo-hydrolase [Thermoanaerobacter]EIV99503.1 metal-dependent hydrolase, beta-lactamase superfamily II [Thermoanaerobacter siderophilus SR4]SDG11106.1 7,8-dihydropterin-6-yl-methyl-4-(beta-D-ribofuranosyl)aminobenzene 5'-phosphate synthase [Thermoanaerobacter thermohydrosulfuricus]
MEIQVLIENVVFNKNFVAEHGLSILVKKDDKEVLVDTGQSENFMKNCGLMGIEVERLQKVVLTHGHYDHIGGLKGLLEKNPNVKIYAHKRILDKKYALRENGNIDEIGFNLAIYNKYKNNFVLIEEDTEVEKDFFVITSTDIVYDNEFTTKNFLIEEKGEKIKDNFLDEVFVVVKEEDGINVITGCSHAGILNILGTAKRRFEGSSLKSLIGGFHLRGMPEEEIIEIAKKIDSYGIEKIYTGHCTGIDEYGILKSVLKDKLSYLTTSSSIIV